MSSDAVSGPLFMHDEGGPRFRIGEVARELEKTGLPSSVARTRVVGYAQQRLIHVRVKGGRATQANEFALIDVAAAKLLSNFQDCGLADREILQRISHNIYSPYNLDQGMYFSGKGTPIQAALAGTFRGEHWSYQVDFYRNTQTEQREINTAFFNLDEGPVWSHPELRGNAEFVPTASLFTIVTPHFLPLSRLISPNTGN